MYVVFLCQEEMFPASGGDLFRETERHILRPKATVTRFGNLSDLFISVIVPRSLISKCFACTFQIETNLIIIFTE